MELIHVGHTQIKKSTWLGPTKPRWGLGASPSLSPAQGTSLWPHPSTGHRAHPASVAVGFSQHRPSQQTTTFLFQTAAKCTADSKEPSTSPLPPPNAR